MPCKRVTFTYYRTADSQWGGAYWNNPPLVLEPTYAYPSMPSFPCTILPSQVAIRQPGDIESWLWRVRLVGTGGTLYASHFVSSSGSSGSTSNVAGFSLTPVGSPELIRITHNKNATGINECNAMYIREYDVCVPDTVYCDSPFDLVLTGEVTTASWELVSPNPSAHVYCGQTLMLANALRAPQIFATFRVCSPPTPFTPVCPVLARPTGAPPAEHICSGTTPPAPGDCFTTSCGECCPADRLTRVARHRHTDGNIYTLAQGTLTRNASGRQISYPAGCSSASVGFPAGDLFQSVVQDRVNPALVAGTRSVSLYSNGDALEGTSLESGQIVWFRSYDGGREFTVQNLTISADFVQSVQHRGRKVIVYFRKRAAGAPSTDPELFLRVGNQGGAGAYTFSAEKALALPVGAPAIKCGDFELSVRDDGKVELGYLSSAPPCGLYLLTSSRIELDGTNEWV